MSGKGKYVFLSNFEEDDYEESSFVNENGKLKVDKKSSFQLKRTISLFEGITVVVGSMIGSGIFVVPTGVLKYCNGNMSLSMGIWVVGGIIAILMALCYIELATLIPESGSTAAYLRRIYGDWMCFVYLWMIIFTSGPQGLAVQIIALGDYIWSALQSSIGACENYKSQFFSKLIGSSIFLVVLIINMVNVKFAVKLQVFCTVGKVAALVLVSVCGMIKILSDSTVLVQNFRYVEYKNSTVDSTSLSQSVPVANFPGIPELSLAVFQALWAYDGFDSVTCITEEVKKPKKNLPLIIVFSVIFVMILYLLVNLSYFSVLSETEMINSNAVAVSFATQFHPVLVFFVTSGVCLSLIGSINVSFLTGGRLPFVAGRLGFMPEIFSMASIKYYSPTPALLLMTFLTALMLIPSSLEALLKAVVFTFWAFRALCSLGILILRKTMANHDRPYKVYIATAVAATILGFYIVLVPLVFQPEIFYLLSIAFFILFLCLYYLIQKKYIKLTGIGQKTHYLQKLFLILPTSDIEMDELKPRLD